MKGPFGKKASWVVSLLVFAPFLALGEAKLNSEMVWIPPGEFLMGSDAGDGRIGIDVGVDSLPKRRLSLRGYWIDQNEVTVGEYKVFVNKTGHEPPALWKDFQTFGYPAPSERHPVIDVNFFDAEAYCRWAGKRLPTEEEWEKAARGTDGRIWPWGKSQELGRMNTEDSGRNWTVPVGELKEGASPYGLNDMAGNAMEWTSSILQSYPQSPRTISPDPKFRILRGGSWGMPANPFARSAHRSYRLADLAQPDFGFRCAKDGQSP